MQKARKKVNQEQKEYLVDIEVILKGVDQKVKEIMIKNY